MFQFSKQGEIGKKGVRDCKVATESLLTSVYFFKASLNFP